MEIATALFKTGDLVLKFLGSPIYKEIQSIRKYEEEFRMLEETVDMIGDVLSDVEGKRFKEESVNKGYARLRKEFLDAEDVVDRVRTLKKKHHAAGDGKLKKVNRFFSKSNPMKNAVNVHSSVKEIRKNLEAISQDLQKYGLKESGISSEADLTTTRATGAYVDAATVIGRDEDKRKILELLLSSSGDESKIPVISIVAMGGMGKTTTAQLVYNDKSVHESFKFETKLWVSDSKRFDFKSLLKHILKSIFPNKDGLDNLEEDHLRQQLVDRIHGKRFFLVLDDVENEDALTWERLEVLLNCGSKESRILVTTRSKKVVKVVGSSSSSYKLEGLSEKDSLQLFEKYAYSGRTDGRLVEIGSLILKKCRGVPLAIKVVGSLLCGEGRRKWEYVRDNSLADVSGEENQLMAILKISYDELDSALKQCFSLCAIFLKNESFPKVKLSNIWKDNVRFKKNKGETLEDVCDKSLRILYNRGFLEVDPDYFERRDDHTGVKLLWDDVKIFKMHDLMHDLAKEVAGIEVLAVDSDNFTLEEEDVRHLSLIYETSTFHRNGRRLRTLLLTPKNVDDIVSNCPVLRFLDIRWGEIENLPNSIGKLIHLRCLFLNSFQLKTLPHSIGELINLRHLGITSSQYLTCLPSEISSLSSLEVLDLKFCSQLAELPIGVENLVNLRQLNLRGCHSLTHLPFGMGALTSLEVLDLSQCTRLAELPIGVENWVNLRQLNLTNCLRLTCLPFGVGALTSLEVLDLNNCFKLAELPIGVENWVNLRQLGLSGCHSLTHLPFGMGALTSLEVLDLSYCSALVELPSSIEKLENLSHLNIERCSSLARVPHTLLHVCTPCIFRVGDPKSKHTAQLEDLAPLPDLHAEMIIKLHNNILLKSPGNEEAFLLNKKHLRKLEIEYQNNQEAEVANNHREVLGKLQPSKHLEEFILSNYQDTMFPSSGFASVLPNLVTLQVVGCMKCQYLPPLSRLACLRELVLCNLSSLEYIEGGGDVSEAPFGLPKLEKLSLEILPKLKAWCRGLPIEVGDNDDYKHDHSSSVWPASFPRLSSLNISGCSALTDPTLLSFLQPFQLNKDLSCKTQDTTSFFQDCINSQFLLIKQKDSLKLFISDISNPGKTLSPCIVEAYNGILHYVTRLRFSVCSQLKTFPLPGMQQLTTLRSLGIYDCPNFTGEEEEEEMQSDQHPRMSWKELQSLEHLTLSKLPKMVKLPEGLQFLTSLKDIKIDNCDNLENLPAWLHANFQEKQHFRGVKWTRKDIGGCSTSS